MPIYDQKQSFIEDLPEGEVQPLAMFPSHDKSRLKVQCKATVKVHCKLVRRADCCGCRPAVFDPKRLFLVRQ